jgi:hypothetical protein
MYCVELHWYVLQTTKWEVINSSLKAEVYLNMWYSKKFSSCLTESTLRVCYKDQLVKSAYRNYRCLVWQLRVIQDGGMPFGSRCFNMLPVVSRDRISTLYVHILHSWDEIHIFVGVAAVGTCNNNRVLKFWSLYIYIYIYIYIYEEVWW